ncbi:lipase 1-like [Maniola hyperantus]|uniref:lipase 1-like n=1 Tax=Aphantopus hyperantus TaxID=2795564 RepID=UPI0037485122
MQTLGILVLVAVTNEYLYAYEIIKGKEFEVFSASEPLNFLGLAEKYGYQSEEYEVTTEDGYILGLFRIPGKRGLPILLMHGFLESSDTWLVRGYTSLGVTLARQDYDVWFGNVRGNKYSRKHVKLNPDKDASFWDFSFQEHGFYDLPAIIDAILAQTGFQKLNAFGYSQGNMIFYVLGSTRREYNEKINVMTALAPVCFLNNIQPPLSLLAEFAPEINGYLEKVGMDELFGNSPSGKTLKGICSNPILGYALCAMGFLFPSSGYDIEELSPSFFYDLLQYFPSATTRKNSYHLAQLALRGRFSKFDYGAEGNLVQYNTKLPPDYDLNRVTMPIVLLAGRNDKISVLVDVDTLKGQLPNVVNYTIVKRELMNHIDYVWGENMKDYLFPYIFDILDKYNSMPQ